MSKKIKADFNKNKRHQFALLSITALMLSEDYADDFAKLMLETDKKLTEEDREKIFNRYKDNVLHPFDFTEIGERIDVIMEWTKEFVELGDMDGWCDAFEADDPVEWSYEYFFRFIETKLRKEKYNSVFQIHETVRNIELKHPNGLHYHTGEDDNYFYFLIANGHDVDDNTKHIKYTFNKVTSKAKKYVSEKTCKICPKCKNTCKICPKCKNEPIFCICDQRKAGL